jgi:uncharacterized protein (TIGR03437 family)
MCMKVQSFFLTLLLLTQSLSARPARSTCGTYPDRLQEELLAHKQANLHRQLSKSLRQMAGLAVTEDPRGAAKDIGNIALLEEDAGLISRRSLFNLNKRTLRFTPQSAPQANSYRFESLPSNYDPAEQTAATPVDGIGDDDSREFTLPFRFPYYGTAFTRIYLNSDGNLTFEGPDGSTRERSLGRLLAGVPRIAPLFTDLDPSRSGSIHVLQRPDRFVVTWLAVPEYADFGIGLRNTLQVRLFPDGRIEMVYEDATSIEGIVGIAPGRLAGGTSIVSFLNETSATYPGAIAERFASAEELDTVTAAQRFYETHDDAYDFLAFYNTLGVSPGPGVVAFEVTVRNQRTGYGDPIVEAGAEYGSSRRLQAILNLGPLSQYPVDPNAILPARFTARDTPITILAHEAGHLFLALASVREPGNPTARPMLGRQSAHWNFTFNSEASLLEGNRIRDNGAGTSPRFETIAVTEQYSPLDQYLMGLRPKEEVPPLFYVSGSTISSFFPPPPQIGRTFDGVRRDVTIDDLIAAEGRRTPDSTVSQRRFRMAIVVITPKGTDPTAEQLAQLETYRREFEALFSRATNQRATMDATLKKGVQFSVSPAAGLLPNRDTPASISVQRPVAAATTFTLRSTGGNTQIPAAVVIPPGQSRTTFNLRGLRPGVDTVEVRPADATFESVEARLQVLDAPRNLTLEITSGNLQIPAPDGTLDQPITIRAVDINKLPYPNQRILAQAPAGATVTPTSALTTEDGTATFRWRPAAPPNNSLIFTLEGVPATELSVTASALGKPFLAAANVTNAASFAPGLTPGALQTLFGANLAAGARVATTLPWPGRANGVSVEVNGRPQPLIFISDNQINFHMADTLTGPTAQIEVQTPLGSTGPIPVQVRPLSPAIFFNGANEGAILRRGDFLEVYGTGFGPLVTQDNLRITQTPVQATINNQPAEVTYAGQAPGFEGLYQINLRLPPNPTGTLRIKLRSNNQDSNEVTYRLP